MRRSVYCTASFSICSLRRAKFPIIYPVLWLDYKVATHPDAGSSRGYTDRHCIIELPPVRLTLSRFQDKLAKVMLIQRPMRFGGLVKRKGLRDMNFERSGPRRP